MIWESMERDYLARAASHPNKVVVQWFEAASKVHDEEDLGEMLCESPGIIGDYLHDGTTALHIAAKYDHDLIAEQLLTEDPSLADAINVMHLDALRTAAKHGSEKVIAVLLAKAPHLLHKVNRDGETALHIAARDGRDNVVAQLLAADPNLSNAVDCRGWTPLHSATSLVHEVVVDMLLANNPQLIFAVAKNGQTVFHMLCQSRSQNKELFARLLALNPGASRPASSSCSSTPLDSAVFVNNECAIELLQWKLTFDEIVEAFTNNKRSFEERLRPIVEGQCACLVEPLLNRDMVNIVFEYLGFNCQSTHKRGRCD